MLFNTDDLRIQSLHPLVSPAILMEEIPLTDEASATVTQGRSHAEKIINGQDDRLLVIVGPCSIHEPEAVVEFGNLLKPVAEKLSDRLEIIMRVYFEKPRTTIGWKGLINDPDLDGSFHINDGLRKARGLLMQLAGMGLPCATEFLDTLIPQFIADVISWGAIGARTTESQVHRELASGLSMPVGFKNGTDGTFQTAVDAVLAAQNPHHFLSVTKQGVAAIVSTKGNESCHLILRGGKNGPNYEAESIRAAADVLNQTGLVPRVMVDCSHGNSRKDHRKQPEVAAAVASQVAEGSQLVMGVMIESFLVEGRQDYRPGGSLVHGQSITDACISWEQTEPVLHQLAEAVTARRNS